MKKRSHKRSNYFIKFTCNSFETSKHDFVKFNSDRMFSIYSAAIDLGIIYLIQAYCFVFLFRSIEVRSVWKLRYKPFCGRKKNQFPRKLPLSDMSLYSQIAGDRHIIGGMHNRFSATRWNFPNPLADDILPIDNYHTIFLHFPPFIISIICSFLLF